MQTQASVTTIRERLKKKLSNTIAKLKSSATSSTVVEPMCPDSQPAEVDAGLPTLPFNPAWSSSLNISFPTGADTASREPYSLACEYPPDSRNHPAYHEMPARRRKSEGQYYARAGLELTHDPKHPRRENAGLRWKRRMADITAWRMQSAIDKLEEDVARLIKMSCLPFSTMVKRHLQLLQLCGEMCVDFTRKRAKIKWLRCSVSKDRSASV